MRRTRKIYLWTIVLGLLAVYGIGGSRALETLLAWSLALATVIFLIALVMVLFEGTDLKGHGLEVLKFLVAYGIAIAAIAGMLEPVERITFPWHQVAVPVMGLGVFGAMTWILCYRPSR